MNSTEKISIAIIQLFFIVVISIIFKSSFTNSVLCVIVCNQFLLSATKKNDGCI
jgi:hypothetical protein